MRKNNKRKMRTMKVSYTTWYEIVTCFANEFDKEYHEIEDAIEMILVEENIQSILKTNKQEANIIEFTNEPNNKMTTMYNSLSFIQDYKEKLKEHFNKRKGLMRAYNDMEVK